MSDRAHNGRRRATTAKRLLADSLAGLDSTILARAAGVRVDQLTRWSASAYKMTIAEKAALAIAVIGIAPESSPLFHDALNLRGQVRAAIEYEAGVTSRGDGPTRTRL
jgi:hypothetical protein